MHGPGTYKDPSCGFSSQFSCTSGAVLESAIASLIGYRRVLMVKFGNFTQ